MYNENENYHPNDSGDPILDRFFLEMLDVDEAGDSKITDTGSTISVQILNQFLEVAQTSIFEVDTSHSISFSTEELEPTEIPKNVLSIIDKCLEYLFNTPLIYDNFENQFSEIGSEKVHHYRRVAYKQLNIVNNTKIRNGTFSGMQLELYCLEKIVPKMNISEKNSDIIKFYIAEFKTISEKILQKYKNYNAVPTLVKVKTAEAHTKVLSDLIGAIITAYREDSVYN